jgi:hypothetical protein
MRKFLLARNRLVFLATCSVCLFSLALSSAEEGPQSKPVSVVSDWTTRHVIYTRVGSMDRILATQGDPRAAFARLRYRMLEHDLRPGRPTHAFRGLRRDWSINLGSGGTAPNMSPAKYTFDVTAAPSCSNDYVIYPVNAPGSATQPNIVAFNNLYSGTGAGGTGSCNRTSPATDDDGTDATVLWSYNVEAVGGSVTTSPVISWDVAGASPSVLGAKVAFVESAPGSPAHFHVLAWKAGDGQDTTDTDGLQSTLHPATISTFVTTAPAVGSGTASDLALGTDPTGTDTLSSPFVDYAHDVAYVGNDIGELYRIKDVFCPSYNNDAGCTAGHAPSLDTSWGSSGAVLVGGGCGMLTSPVEDFATGNVFVGCSDGRLYGFNASGAALSPHSIGVGDGTTFGGIVDAPIVDSTNGLVYAVSGTDGTSPLLVQTNTSLSVKRAAALGFPAGANLHLPAFNDAYFSSVTPSSWAIFSCGFDSTGALTTLYDVGFSSARALDTGTPPAANQFTLSNLVEQCSPLTEFINVPGPPLAPTDRLFLSLLSTQAINSYDITSVSGTGFPGGFTESATQAEPGGTSGIIVDNESNTEIQASSIYFSTLRSTSCGAGGTGFCAVKLTQAGLN